MMKKVFALLFVLLLCGCCAFALAESPLQPEEVTGLCRDLLEEALAQEAVEAEEMGDGTYAFTFDQFTVVCTGDTLAEDSEVVSAGFWGGIASFADRRGIGPGSSLDELLAAYPLDNAALSGAYDDAVLYISGALPGNAQYGYILRSGSRVLQAEHDAAVSEGDEVYEYYMSYTLENNVVTGVYFGVSGQTLAEAQEELDDLSARQEERVYSVYSAADPEPLAREDLLFCGPKGAIDFVSAGEADLKAVLGEPQADNWEQEEDIFFRTLEWEGVTAVLAYDGQKQNSVLTGLQVYGEQLEGPRGLHMDDPLDSVIARFPQTGEDAQQEVESVFGLLGEGEEGVCLQYAVALEDSTVVLDLDFVDDALFVITCVHQ